MATGDVHLTFELHDEPLIEVHGRPNITGALTTGSAAATSSSAAATGSSNQATTEVTSITVNTDATGTTATTEGDCP